jgi:hypothetical protein
VGTAEPAQLAEALLRLVYGRHCLEDRVTTTGAVTLGDPGVRLCTPTGLADSIYIDDIFNVRRCDSVPASLASDLAHPARWRPLTKFSVRYPSYLRSGLKPARTSSEKSWGCSHAAKCPPLSSLL